MANNGVYYSGGQGGTGLNLTSGDVTRINISTGGTITFNNDYSFPTADGGANEVLVTDGAGNITFNTLSNASLDNSSITINNTSVSLGGSINVGTVTSVGITAGALIDVTNSPITTSGNITVAVDLSELTDMTATMTGTDEFVVLDSSAQRRKAANEIDLSIFSDDVTIYESNGTLSGVRTLSQGGNKLIFDSSSTESFDVVKTALAAGGNDPRMFIEADNAYGTVLELESPEAAVFYIRARNTAGDVSFSVDGEGNLLAASKSFLIKHPTKEDYALRYGSLEGPEHGVYVRGRLNGTNTIELPDYWVELIDESTITVQLTSIGKHQNLYVKDIVDNTIVVANGNLLSSKINCFYFVQAERKDIEKMVVEFPRGTEPLQ